MYEKSIFISHSSKDSEIALKIWEELEERYSNSAWIDTFDLTSGDELVPIISKAVGRAKWFILIASKSSMESNWVQHEAKLALFRGIEKKDFHVSDFLKKNDGCFQSIILQNDFFKEINESSTATLRITTVRDQTGKIGARAAYLRVGRENDGFVRSDSGVRIPVEISTGLLGEVGFMNDWSYSTRHPDSGYLYSGNQIPFFSDAIQLCITLHEGFPHFELIGWDVCVDQENEVKIMEWNANGADILFHEAFTGPCFTGLGWEDCWRKTREDDVTLFV